MRNKGNKKNKKFIMMRPIDYIFVGFLFLSSVFLLIYLPLYFGNSKGSEVVVMVNKDTYGVYDLNLNQEVLVDVDGRINVFVIEDGLVTMIDANCRDRVCINHGSIEKTYEAITCLPNKVLIKIVKPEGEEEEIDEIDSISS